MASKTPNRSRLRRTVVGLFKFSLYGLILGLIVDTLLHVIPFTAALIARYWPPV